MTSVEQALYPGNGELLQTRDKKLSNNAFGWDTVTAVDIGGVEVPIALRGMGVRSIVLGDHVITNRRFKLASFPEDLEDGLAGTVIRINPDLGSDNLLAVLFTKKDVEGNQQDLLRPSDISFPEPLERHRETPVSVFKVPYQYMGRVINLIMIDDEGGTDVATRHSSQRRIGMIEIPTADGGRQLEKIGDDSSRIDGPIKYYSHIYDIRIASNGNQDKILLLNNGVNTGENKMLMLEDYLGWEKVAS